MLICTTNHFHLYYTCIMNIMLNIIRFIWISFIFVIPTYSTLYCDKTIEISRSFINTGDFEPMSSLLHHRSGDIKSRACSLLGNLMKHHGQFYSTMKQRYEDVISCYECLVDLRPSLLCILCHSHYGKPECENMCLWKFDLSWCGHAPAV